MPRTGKTEDDTEAASKGEQLAHLEKRLGHVFANRGLLERALTHSSAVVESGVVTASATESNERFEFLGDRVLGLVIAELLVRSFPRAEEGELSLRLNALVRKEACAAIAENIGLGAHLVLGRSERKTGGREKAAILGDACEALIAALYLDGGLEAARVFIEAEWSPLVAETTSGRQDAKTALQEWSQKRGQGVPRYRTISRSGPDHAPDFVVEVEIEGLAPMQGEAGSKRQAEQHAARALLIREAVWREND